MVYCGKNRHHVDLRLRQGREHTEQDGVCPVRHPVEVIRVVLLRTLCLIGGGINCIVDF